MRLLLPSVALLALLSQAALGADFEPAAFHEKNCTGCHDSGVYTRKNRMIQTKGQLYNRVRACDNNFGAKLPGERLDILVDYLDDTWYHLGQ